MTLLQFATKVRAYTELCEKAALALYPELAVQFIEETDGIRQMCEELICEKRQLKPRPKKTSKTDAV